MNKDEKNISVGEEEAKASPEAPKAPAAKNTPADKKPSGIAAWWNKTGTGIKAAVIAAIALVVIIPVILITACGGKGGFGGATVGGGANQKTSYSITFTTQGGMAISDKPVYIYEYSGGSLGNLVTGGYASTDENGKAVFSLPKNGSFAAQISLPDGYDAAAFYPLVNKEMNIQVNTAVIPESSLAGVSYELGGVIRDFTVKTTEGKNFTLSEVLKTKKAVLINFWYDGCSWCETEFPLMQKAYEKYSDDLAIIALDPPHASGNRDTLTSIAQYKASLGLTFDVAMDNSGIYSAFGVEGYPFTAIVDRYGVIAFVEPGAITSERVFEVIFEHFTAENYEQKLIVDYEDIVPKEKPNLQMPSSDEMSEVFDGGLIEDVEYLPYPSDASQEEKEYSWPFVDAEIEEGDGKIPVIMPSNSGKEGSYAQLIVEVPMKAGDVLAFDYYSSTELGADILYIVVDGKDIYSISGESTEWDTCYAYVAEEDATYEVGFVYTKDSSDNVGDDTVYLKNLRVVSVDDIDSPTYIFRFAATNPNNYNEYQDYVEIFLGSDGYYHVDSADGPILLADLMGYTRFSAETSAYYMAVDYLNAAQQKYDEKKITLAEFEKYQRKYDRLVQYCNYASNASIYGVSPVTEELMELLIELSEFNGVIDSEKGVKWLQFCCYYDSYGTDEELADPIKGLSPFSAYDTVLSNKGAKDFPNKIVYDRMIMPRGMFYKFTPSQSGTYLVSSYAPAANGGMIDCEAWIFVADDNTFNQWYTYANADRNNIGHKHMDLSNVYMIAYLEAGKDYYINIAYADVYQEGTISFRLERLGGEGIYRFSLASPGYYTSLLNGAGELTETISGGIDLVLGEDGYWREAREDNREGSLLYADFEKPTGMFDYSIKELIEMGAFNLSTNEDDEYILALMKSNQAYNFYLDLYLRDLWGDEYDEKYEEYKVSDVLAGIYHGAEDKDGNPTKSDNDNYILDLREDMKDNDSYNNDANFLEFLKSYWGEDSYEGYMEEYQVDDILLGIYHGSGEDYTDEISAYLDKVIKQGNNDVIGYVPADDGRIGCVVVDAELAELLQVIMYKYSFEGIENSWAKLCYYHQYFCAATPN